MNGTPIDSGLPKGVPTGGLFGYDPANPDKLGTGANIISSLIIFLVIVAILFTLWEIGKGGLEMIQSKGLKEQLKKGRERTLLGILGLIMIFASFFIASIASAFFGFDIIPFLKF